MVNTIKKMIAPLQRRIMLMICRGVVTMIDDTKKMQTLQVTLLEGECTTLPRHQDYGFTSYPPVGSEVVAAFVGGCRDNGIIIRCESREHRIKLPNAGDVCVYDSHGNKMVLSPDENKITIESIDTVEIVADRVTVSANNVVVNSNDIALGGAPGDPVVLSSFISTFNSHTHLFPATPQGAPTGAPVIPAIEQAVCTTSVKAV